jgi:hypothetical protein
MRYLSSAAPFLVTLGTLTLAAIGAPTANAQVIVNGFYNPSGGGFLYNVQVFNNTASTIDFIDLTIPASVNPTNLTAPVGFLNIYDSGLDLLTFAEDADVLTTQSFAPGTTVGFFSFQANTVLTSVPFTGFDRSGGTPTGIATFVQTTAPEPASLALLGAGIGVLAVRRRRAAR